MNKTASILIIVSITFLMVACTEKSDQATTEPKPGNLKGDDVILASVNDSPITKYDLNQTIRSTLGRSSASKLDEEGRKKVLESLVASRAIAQVQEKALTPKETAALEKKINSYREKLLVKQHLAKNVPLQPVTQEMIQKYYRDHPEKFGEKKTRTYEMIVSQENLEIKARDGLIKALKNPQEKKDWAKWVKDLKKNNHEVSYRKGQLSDKILNSKLRNLMASLKMGDTSSLTFIRGMVYIVRIRDEKQIPPRPLKDVSGQIRKTLSPIQIKKAVKQASEDVLEEVNVVYH